MKYRAEHEISWKYDGPVFVEPMTVRLRPRCDGSLHLLDWQLTFHPQPAGTCHSLDALGNAVSLAWFNEVQDALVVTAVSSVETTRDNPFDYLLTGHDARKLPLRYDDVLQDWLHPYCQRPAVDKRIDEWANELAATSADAQGLLLSLVSAMFTDFERTTREDGDALSPSETFDSRRGACRDLAVLFIDACRSVGIAARFVSGYAFEADREGLSDLHAWAEVYLPGAGWRGYDPSLGLAVADQHIVLAAAPEPSAAAPTSGTFRGNGAKSTMEFRINLQAVGRP